VLRSAPPEVAKLYVLPGSSDRWWLDVGKCPPDERVRWRQVSRELNDREYEDMMEYRDMYTWSGSETRWLLKPEFSAWGRDV
jgi:hypothetical protein